MRRRERIGDLNAVAQRFGDPHAALRIYERNRVEEIGTEDAVALKGRLLKDLAVRADGGERERLFRESSEAYQRANKLSDGYFSGINAATTSFLAGEKDRARKLATAIGERPDVAQPDNFFAAASGAEAMLVRGEIDEATALYAAARKRPDASPGSIASTARQVKLIAAHMDMPDDKRERLLASIRPSPIIHFCGHMFRAGWEAEQDIRRAVDGILDETGALIAYAPPACGADIVIAEAILERGGELHAVMPFAEEDFLRTSVRLGGPQWLERYHRTRDAAASVTFGVPLVTAR